MYYPWWYVPGLTAPMLIAFVALIHVFVSHYAVGGGILLALENGYAHRTANNNYRNYWKKHLRFFVLLTIAFGAITGVGIWWIIGLASPLATEELIRTFVFGWAIEWCFFILEIVAAFAFYYYWDKMRPRAHTIVGWIYGLSAWISLVLITAITAYMLNSQSLLGEPVPNPETGVVHGFWHAFFNLQFLPQTAARTGGALILSTFYVYCHATLVEKNDDVREKIVQRMRIPSIVGLVSLVIGVIGWFFFLPASSLMMLECAAVINLFLGLFAAIMVAVVFLLLVGPFYAPRRMSFALAAALLMFGIAGIAVAEFVREAVRKPFIIDGCIYGNQVYAEDVSSLQQKGYLASGVWTTLYLQKLQTKYPDITLISTKMLEPVALTSKEMVAPIASFVEAPVPGRPAVSEIEILPVRYKRPKKIIAKTEVSVHYANLLNVTPEDRVELGKLLFMHHCNDCHAADRGYSAVGPLLTGKTQSEMIHFILNLNRPGFFMPPWCGNEIEAELLSDYLLTIRPEMPSNMLPVVDQIAQQ